MGLFDLLTGGNPSAQIAAAFRPQVNPSVAPGGPQGAPGAAPGGGAAPTPPGGAGAAGGAAPGPQGPQNAPPQPQAYQSPPDLVSLYTQLAQRQQANEGFNRGIAMMAAGFARPEDRAMMINAMSGQTQDPGAIFGNIMKLQQFNQQQQQYQAFMRAAPDIAKTLSQGGVNFSPDEVLSMGPKALDMALQYNAPPEAMRNWTYAKRQWIQAHPEDPTGAQFEQQFPMSMAIVGAIPGLDPTTRDRNLELTQWQAQNPGKTPPSYLTNNADFQAHTKQKADETTDFVEAQNKFPGLLATAKQYEQDLDTLGNAPNLGNIIGKNISVADSPAAAKAQGFSQADYDLDQVRKRLYGEDYAKSFTEGQGRRSTQEVAGLQAGRSNFQTTGMSVPQFQDQAIVRQRVNNFKLMANAYMASGNGASMPNYLKPYVNPEYQQEDWAQRNAPHTVQPNGKPLSAAQLAEGRQMVERVGADKLIQTLKAGGWDTSQFE